MRRQRGIALILALVVVALATMFATRIGSQAALEQRRAANSFLQEQAFEIALGAEVWAQEILFEQKQNGGNRDSLDQIWATPLPPLPVDGGTVQGSLEDMQGRFNLNNLVNADDTPNELAVAHLRRMLRALELEDKWANLIVDWIDRNNNVTLPDGAEDNAYTSQSPPYLAANQRLITTSELLSLPGFGPDRYARLSPYVTALPAPSTINTCTAGPLVLSTLAESMKTNFTQDPKSLARNRQKGCFPLNDDVRTMVSPNDWNLLSGAKNGAKYLGESSSWFKATVVVSIGSAEFTLYTLLQRNGPASRPVLRSFGSDL